MFSKDGLFLNSVVLAAALGLIVLVVLSLARLWRYSHLTRNVNVYVFDQLGQSVRLVTTPEECIKNIEELISMRPKVLGMDCEWKPNFAKISKTNPHNKVSLLQLCNDKICLLIRLKDIQERSQGIPLILFKLMANKQVLKTGLNISGDAVKLYQDYGMQVRGCVELSQIVKQKCAFYNYLKTHPSTRNIQSLDGLVFLLLNELDMQKNKQISTSNWEENPLTMEQMQYAANDCILSFYAFIQAILNMNNENTLDCSHFTPLFQVKNEKKIYDILNKSGHPSDPIIKPDVLARLLSDRDTKNSVDLLKLCDGIIDSKIVKLEQKSAKTSSRSSSSAIDAEVQASKRLKKITSQSEIYAARTKKAQYQNCKLYLKDGSLLTACSKRKLEWYLRNNLAVPHETDPKAVVLQIEPDYSKDRTGNEKFEQERKIVSKWVRKSVCVICGSSDKLERFRLLPANFVKLLPHGYKMQNTQDIVIVCHNVRYYTYEPGRRVGVTCHSLALKNKESTLSELLKNYNIDNLTFDPLGELKRRERVRCLAMKLQSNRTDERITVEKKHEWIRAIAEYYRLEGSVDELDEQVDDELISKAAKLKPTKKEWSEGRMALQEWQFKELMRCLNEDYYQFIKIWRKSFKDNLNPQCLPEYWTDSFVN